MSYKVIAALGDSITNGYWDETFAGWFGRMAARISAARPQAFGFYNLSQDGDRICDAYHRLGAELLTRYPADILIIAIGVNDLLRGPDSDSPTDLSPHLRAEYWNRLLDIAQKNIKNIIVLDILPIREELIPIEESDGNMWWHNADIAEYNDLIAKICRERKIPFVRRYDAWATRDLSKLYADDAHPNGAGHQMIADEVVAELEKLKLLN
ncbi:MAG: SGNH/GDSL hydrolase family protein [Proteobacteria bacterium]|nr:SGNH/GDSL hydrolase family protein [Pseudomonadota bacterium]